MLFKSKMKQFLIGAGLWYPLTFVRLIPEILNWLKSGCSGVAPHVIKMMAVKSYLRKYVINEFVETGTHLGETLGYIAESGVRCSSIELSQEFYTAACKRFHGRKNVSLMQGDSGQKLPILLAELTTSALFWLDGHYSAGNTACAGIASPISIELKAILNHSVKQHVILIDDAHCFNGMDGYPYLGDLLLEILNNGNYTAEVSIDIIRLIPRVAVKK